MINADDIKLKNDIIEVIESVIELKKSGANYSACCPFHSERTPSFTVSEHKQFYHCFGCGASGDVIDFVKEYYNLDFVDACKHLGHQADISPIKAEVNKRKNMERALIRLPFDNPLSGDVIRSFFTKCDTFGDNDSQIFYYDNAQAVLMTSINKVPANIALVKSGYEPRFYGKRFMYGTCCVFGDLQQGDVIFTDNYHQAVKLNLVDGLASVWYHCPKNLFYMAEQVKRYELNATWLGSCDEFDYWVDKLNLVNTKRMEKAQCIN